MPAAAAASATRLSSAAVPAAPEPDDHARHAAVAHDQIGADTDHRDGDVGGQVFQKISEVVFVFRREVDLRRTADAKPGERPERLVRRHPAAQLRQAGFEIGGDVGKSHDQPNNMARPKSKSVTLFGRSDNGRNLSVRPLSVPMIDASVSAGWLTPD